MPPRYGWTRYGVCRILEEGKTKARILLPNRRKAWWVSKTKLKNTPSRFILYKAAAGFNPACNCTAIVKVNHNLIEAFNLYGSIQKYLKAKTVEADPQASPYFRRKYLAEHGFTRASGLKRRAKDVLALTYDYQRDGYKPVLQ